MSNESSHGMSAWEVLALVVLSLIFLAVAITIGSQMIAGAKQEIEITLLLVGRIMTGVFILAAIALVFKHYHK